MTGLAYRASDANILVYCKSSFVIHKQVWVSQTIHKHSCVSQNAFFHSQSVGRFAVRRAVARRHLLAETDPRWTSIAHTRAFLFTGVSIADLIAAAAGPRTAVLSYDETERTRERVDIAKLNAELATTVATIDQLRTEIDAIVAEIEGKEVEA